MTSMTNGMHEYKKRSMLPEIWRRFKKNKRAVLGLVILICLVLVAVFANLLPYDPYAMAPTERLQTSSLKHWMNSAGIFLRVSAMARGFPLRLRLLQQHLRAFRARCSARSRVFTEENWKA